MITTALLIFTHTLAMVFGAYAGARLALRHKERRKRIAQGQLDATESMFARNPEGAAREAGV